MNYNVIFHCLLVFLIAFTKLSAQQYNFRNYSVREGLAQSQVYDICEDLNGNVWFATRGGGISRFDGNGFENYTEEEGLVSNYTRTMIRDKSGNLWIGTDHGISRYDGRKFRNYTNANGLYSEIINDLLEDSRGTIWIASEKGLFHLDKDTVIRFGRKLNIPFEKINCLFEDNQRNVWAGTERGVYRFTFDNGQWTSQFFTAMDGLPGNIIISVCEDSEKNLWFSTYGDGVSCYKEGKFINFTMEHGLAGNTVFCSNAGKNGEIWFGTAQGLTRYVGSGGGENIFKTYTEAEGLPNNVVMCVFKDSFGNTWLGTSGGGAGRLDSERFVHFKSIKGLFGSWVYSIFEDKHGSLWFGTSEGGVTRYDGKYYKRFSAKDGFTAARVRCIHQDKHGNMWFGTVASGAYMFDANSFTHYSGRNGLSSNFVNSIVSDTSGNVWMGTAGGGISFLKYEGNKYSIEHITARSGLAGNRVNVLMMDDYFDLWAGTTDNGISRIRVDSSGKFDIVNFNAKNGLAANNIRSLAKDKKGNIYFGTAGAGIMKYDGHRFSNFGKKQGLASNNIYSLIFDDVDQLWIGSEKGIDKVWLDEKNKLNVRHFGRAEGFIGIETIQNSACKDREGNLWFGTIECATVYKAKEDMMNSSPPRLHITGLRLFFDKIENTKYGRNLIPWYPLPESLTLPYHRNHLSFEFTGINLKNPEGVRYKYMLEGFDKSWSPESNKREAVYSNLPPGTYTFKVISGNEDGIWNDTPQTFAFVITPPVWDTWWFRILSILLIVFAVGYIFSARIRRIRKKNEEERQKLEVERTLVELEQKALRLLMNPHFLFNCLNSIKGLIAENKQSEAKIYLSKFARLMRAILDNSMEAFIVLEEEIAALRTYAELEMLSREDKFDFSIEIDETTDPASIEIPPMIVQPFLENAIIHGIAPMQGKGKITVSFKIKGDHLLCIVEDNGIGRKKAEEMKSDSMTHHKSAAIAVTQERLNILNKKLNFGEINITITDLVDKQEEALGTRVEILIAYRTL